MKKVFTVVGARPQFIKAAVVSRALKKSGTLVEYIFHTGQHYDDNMSQVFFREMGIPQPDKELTLSQRLHGGMTGEMLTAIEKQMIFEKPDVVLVYGDTNSTLAAALAASKLHIPVAHVEAGMRSFDKRIPEEINRVLTDHVSEFLFCTTNEPAQNLRKEGIDNGKIYVLGDVMYDAVLYYQKQIKKSKLLNDIEDDFYLVTIHRQENTDNIVNLQNILNAFQILAQTKPVVVPLHPRTKKVIQENGFNTDNIRFLPPVGYFDMLYLLQKTSCVITDSGGLQREAYYMNKPCVVMRHVTEWKELIDVGVAKIAGAETQKIVQAVKDLENIVDFPGGIYGDGHAGDKIVKIISDKIS